MHRIESRVRRLNALGFDVAELDITTDFAGSTIRIQPKVVDAGHHQRRLMRLTGLDTEENQARRLLNDLDYYRARTDQQGADESIVAHQWLTEVFEPVVTSVPAEPAGQARAGRALPRGAGAPLVHERAGRHPDRPGRRGRRATCTRSWPACPTRRSPSRTWSRWVRWPTRTTRRRATSTRRPRSRTTPGRTATRLRGGSGRGTRVRRLSGHRGAAGEDGQMSEPRPPRAGRGPDHHRGPRRALGAQARRLRPSASRRPGSWPGSTTTGRPGSATSPRAELLVPADDHQPRQAAGGAGAGGAPDPPGRRPAWMISLTGKASEELASAAGATWAKPGAVPRPGCRAATQGAARGHRGHAPDR